mgnify:CR=1 FL=1
MKRAFIIGLNYASEEYALSGCEFDADNLYRRMTAAGIPKKNITVAKGEISASDLFDILAGWSVSSKPTDTTYITFSGHGTQLYGPGEKDGIDEAICLYTVENGIEVVLDDDLRGAIQKIPGAVVLILDSCFSGGMQRTVAQPLNRQYRRKFIHFEAGRMSIFDFAERRVPAKPIHNVLYFLNACAEGEVSWDTGTGGLFTTVLCHYYDIGVKRVGALIAQTRLSCEPDQSPNLVMVKGSGNKRLF